jgi:hypothetical protein
MNKPLFQIFLLLFFSLSVLSQNECPINCENLVKNGGFEDLNLSAGCPYPGTWFPGYGYFTLGCVIDWSAPQTTPDLLFPNMGFGELDNHVISNYAALCYGGWSNGPSHSETLISENFNTPLLNDQDIEYSLDFNFAVACSTVDQADYENGILVSPPSGGEFQIDFQSGQQVFSQTLGPQYDIRNGFTNVCIQKLPVNFYEEFLSIETTQGVTTNYTEICWAIFDNINISCEITDFPYEIVATELTNNTVRFELQINGISGGNNFVSYLWNFGDGNTSTSGTPTNHTYASEGVYEVCLDVIDDRQCCGQVCTVINLGGKQCDYYVCLDCMSIGVPLATDLEIKNPYSGQVETYSSINTGCCFGNPSGFDYCFGDPGYCLQYNGSGGFQYNELVADINAFLVNHGDPGNAHIVITSIHDPNYPCRNAIIRIDDTKMEFTNLLGRDPISGQSLNCTFTKECN